MTRTHMLFGVALVAGAALLAGGLLSSRASAQTPAVSAAIADGSVGEQSDGYLGINGSVSADVRSGVEAINIKRRAAYTDLAAKRGVTVADMAAATGCQTLASRVKSGQAYRIGAGSWQVKGGGAIDLPGYCATAN
ncbi:YdbL family protein [Sphingobium sufflavum]|uniref:YdbL family protein n=1 Tax=Sphingobium sufflavum TaxID=1129547 RepID=UPI001F425556|nr:YdbL family protein [Sphingobium sufflavum]MCE7797019.1 YdbL family protein [Sphingobium sufflavum]